MYGLGITDIYNIHDWITIKFYPNQKLISKSVQHLHFKIYGRTTRRKTVSEIVRTK